jgi:DNA-binding transcriptional ArsR family regulator
MSLAAVSKHLKVLEDAGLIHKDRQAQRRPCRIEPKTLEAVDGWLGDYRQLWTESFDRLDDYLKTLSTKPHTKEKRHVRRKK